MRRLLVPLLAGGLAAAVHSLVAAAPVGQASLNAIAFQPLPAGEPIEVRVLNDSTENLAIKQQLETALAGHGHPVGSAGASLVLSIDTGDSSGAWNAPGATDRVRMMDDRGRLFPQGELDISRQARFPLPETTVVTPVQFRIGLTLDSRTSGQRLWQGWTAADLSQGEPDEMAQAMVPKLAGSLGRTVREETFDLQ